MRQDGVEPYPDVVVREVDVGAEWDDRVRIDGARLVEEPPVRLDGARDRGGVRDGTDGRNGAAGAAG